MKQFNRLFFLICFAQVLSCSGQVLSPFPAVNFSAILDGADENPPNSSSWTATAGIIYQPAPTNWFTIAMVFPKFEFEFASQADHIVASVQRENGEVVTNSDGPFILNVSCF